MSVAGEQCTLEIGVNPTGDVLVRILATLRRRGCRIDAVDFVAGDRHRPTRLRVGVVLPTRGRDQVTRWVQRLVDVLDVAAC
jgi:acetolactate synthase small subunit